MAVPMGQKHILKVTATFSLLFLKSNPPVLLQHLWAPKQVFSIKQKEFCNTLLFSSFSFSQNLLPSRFLGHRSFYIL